MSKPFLEPGGVVEVADDHDQPLALGSVDEPLADPGEVGDFALRWQVFEEFEEREDPVLASGHREVGRDVAGERHDPARSRFARAM